MNYARLQSLRDRLFFSVEDVAQALGIKASSAPVLCSRYVQKGIFVRLKRNVYILAERWRNLGGDDFIAVANFLQVPSYLSLLSALVYYEVTTQVPRMVWESASLKRSTGLSIDGVEFRYYKVAEQLYRGFRNNNGLFIAEREKALLDSVYLASLGRYSLDMEALDIGKLEPEGIARWIGYYPDNVQQLVSKIWTT
jgi:predicted transcriptional regulator of viral defense system